MCNVLKYNIKYSRCSEGESNLLGGTVGNFMDKLHRSGLERKTGVCSLSKSSCIKYQQCRDNGRMFWAEILLRAKMRSETSSEAVL